MACPTLKSGTGLGGQAAAAMNSARLAATATVLSATHPVAGAALGVWSIVVGLSRVTLGAHYLLDVAAGLAIGALAGGAARGLAPGKGIGTPSGRATPSW